MWLCGTPYLPGLELCWYPLCLLNLHICWSLYLTSLFTPSRSRPVRDASTLSTLTLCRLSLQEARAEWDHQGQAFITGSLSPPPGTRLRVQARQDALLGQLTLKNVAERKSVTKRNRKEISKLGREVFLLFLFVLELFISSLSFCFQFCFY